MTLPLHDFPDWQRDLATADLIVNQSSQALNAGNFLNLAAQDLRPYSSFAVEVDVTTNAAPTAWNGIGISIGWKDLASLGKAIYDDVYFIIPKGVGGAFATDNGRFELQDAVHGPFLFVSLFNAGVDNCTATINLYGNSRALGRRYVQNVAVASGGFSIDVSSSQLLSVNSTPLGAGAVIETAVRMAPGVAYTRMQSVVGAMIFQYFTPNGKEINGFNVAAGQDLHTDLALPRSAVICRVTDTSGAPNNYQWMLTTSRTSW